MSVVAVVALGGLAACESCNKTSGSGAAKEDMQLAPKETDVVFMANLARVRNTEIWRRAIEMRDQDAQAKKDYEDFATKCQLDPLKQIDSVFAGFPHTTETKEFVVVLRGTFNEAKLLECSREQAKKDGSEIVESEYGGHKLYTTSKSGQAFATFLDPKTIVIGGKEWIKKSVDLATKKEPGASAKDNTELMALLKRVNSNAGLWGAGLVPQSTRDQLKNDPHLSSAGSMKDVFGSIDFANGLLADLSVDLGTDADAAEMAKKVNEQVADARKSPQFMMAGLNAFLDAVKVDSKGPTFRVVVNFNQQQVSDIINRLKGLLSSLKNSLGGQMGLPAQPPTP
jgi:hypothetical protein